MTATKPSEPADVTTTGHEHPARADGAALVIIDMQRDLVCDDLGELLPWAGDAVVAAAGAVDWAHRHDVPVIWVRVQRRADYADAPSARTDLSARRAGGARRLVAGTVGADLAPGLEPHAGDFDLVKPRVNAFFGTNLGALLHRLGVDRILVGGVWTHMGVEATVRGSYDRDIDAVVLTDACAAASRALHEHSVTAILPSIAVTITTAELPQ